MEPLEKAGNDMEKKNKFFYAIRMRNLPLPSKGKGEAGAGERCMVEPGNRKLPCT